jgi:hypothetical protein
MAQESAEKSMSVAQKVLVCTQTTERMDTPVSRPLLSSNR